MNKIMVFLNNYRKPGWMVVISTISVDCAAVYIIPHAGVGLSYLKIHQFPYAQIRVLYQIQFQGLNHKGKLMIQLQD